MTFFQPSSLTITGEYWHHQSILSFALDINNEVEKPHFQVASRSDWKTSHFMNRTQPRVPFRGVTLSLRKLGVSPRSGETSVFAGYVTFGVFTQKGLRTILPVTNSRPMSRVMLKYPPSISLIQYLRSRLVKWGIQVLKSSVKDFSMEQNDYNQGFHLQISFLEFWYNAKLFLINIYTVARWVRRVQVSCPATLPWHTSF